jgi:hypothetical protein
MNITIQGIIMNTKKITHYSGITYGHTHCPLCMESMEKWIEVYKIGDMCITCAQNIMRIMFEDIIKYYNQNNQKNVTLLDILLHGDIDNKRNLEFWLGERFSDFYPEMENLCSNKESGKPQKMVNDIDKHKNCSICQKCVEKWIDVYPSETLCVDCAQYILRTLLEDIIEYHNEKRVSLAEIMYYGNPTIDCMIDSEKQIEEKSMKTEIKPSKLFDFDNKK